MSVQGEINKALGTAAAAASIAKGISVAKEKEAQAEEDKKKLAEKEAAKDAAKKEADELKAKKQAEAEKKSAEREEAAKAKEKKIEDRQNLLFLEQSQNKVEAQRRSIAGLNKKKEENAALENELKATIKSKKTGRIARREAMASLLDLQEQDKVLDVDVSTRERLLKERQEMAANVRKEFNYGEK